MLVYRGKEFRKRHGLTQVELAAGAGLREATLVDLERGHVTPTTTTLTKLITYFRARGIACDVGDLLVYEAEEPDGRRDGGE